MPIPIPVPGPVPGPVRRVNANLGVDRTSITPLLYGLRMQSRQGTREPSVGGFSRNGGTIPPRETLHGNGSAISSFLSTPSLADSNALPTIPEASANSQVIPAYGQDMNVGGNVPVSAGNQVSLLPDPSLYPNSFGNDQFSYSQSTGSTSAYPAAPYDPNAATAALGTTTGNPDWAVPSAPRASTRRSFRPDPYGATGPIRPASPKKRPGERPGAEEPPRQRVKTLGSTWIDPDADLNEEEDQPRVMGKRKGVMGPPPRPQKKPAENAPPARKGDKE